MFRMLVGAAAIAMIAFVGYYFLREYQWSQTRARLAGAAQCEQAERDGRALSLALERGEAVSNLTRLRVRTALQQCESWLRR